MKLKLKRFARVIVFLTVVFILVTEGISYTTEQFWFIIALLFVLDILA